MGIDVYLRWKDQTEPERKAQYTGFSVVAGAVGYLREAYHGGPYATEVLAPEGFQDDAPEDGPQIPAAVLRERLPTVLATAMERAKIVYKEELADDSPVLRAFVDFVELAERKEKETGEPCRVLVSA